MFIAPLTTPACALNVDRHRPRWGYASAANIAATASRVAETTGFGVWSSR